MLQHLCSSLAQSTDTKLPTRNTSLHVCIVRCKSVTRVRSCCRVLKSRVPHISDTLSLFSAPGKGTIIGPAARTDSERISTQRNRDAQREREKVRSWHKEGERVNKKTWVREEQVNPVMRPALLVFCNQTFVGGKNCSETVIT